MNGLEDNPILTPLHLQVLKALFSDEWFSSTFYLTGGTALSAFYLQHRDSEDLDFFTHESLPPEAHQTLQALLKGKVNSIKSITRSPGFIRLEVDDLLKLDFVSDVQARFGVPKAVEGVRIDTEENIAVNKVGTILGRLDPKDYVDLMFLIRDQGYDVFDLMEKAKQKDGGMEPFIWSELIGDCETFAVLPRMRKPLALDELKSFYRKLRKEIVGKLKP